MHEGRTHFAVTVIVGEQNSAPGGEHQECDDSAVEACAADLIQRGEQRAFSRFLDARRGRRCPFEEIDPAERAGRSFRQRLRQALSALGALRVGALHGHEDSTSCGDVLEVSHFPPAAIPAILLPLPFKSNCPAWQVFGVWS